MFSFKQIKCLHGLSRFPALGSLVLSDNCLDWQELKRISHIHLLSLTLTGNLKLDNDPHCKYTSDHYFTALLPYLLNRPLSCY